MQAAGPSSNRSGALAACFAAAVLPRTRNAGWMQEMGIYGAEETTQTTKEGPRVIRVCLGSAKPKKIILRTRCGIGWYFGPPGGSPIDHC